MSRQHMSAAHFPGSAAAREAVVRVLRAFRREARRDPRGLELEVRFGTNAGGRVTSGVSLEAVDHVMRLVRSNPAYFRGCNDQWHEIEDSFFEHEQRDCRLRAEYDTEELRVNITAVRKRRLAECSLTLAQHPALGVRVVLSREVPVSTADLPEVVTPKHVRIQQRKSIRYGSGGVQTWMIELGMVWAGRNKADAEAKQASDAPPAYTLELELLDPSYITSRPDDDYCAASLMMKAADLVAEEAVSFEAA